MPEIQRPTPEQAIRNIDDALIDAHARERVAEQQIAFWQEALTYARLNISSLGDLRDQRAQEQQARQQAQADG